MQVIGKIFRLGDNLGGTSERGEWVKKTVVIETTDVDSKKIAFEAFGEKVVADCNNTLYNGEPYNYKVGDIVQISFDIRSREYEGRWFTNLSLYSMELLQPVKM